MVTGPGVKGIVTNHGLVKLFDGDRIGNFLVLLEDFFSNRDDLVSFFGVVELW